VVGDVFSYMFVKVCVCVDMCTVIDTPPPTPKKTHRRIYYRKYWVTSPPPPLPANTHTYTIICMDDDMNMYRVVWWKVPYTIWDMCVCVCVCVCKCPLSAYVPPHNICTYVPLFIVSAHYMHMRECPLCTCVPVTYVHSGHSECPLRTYVWVSIMYICVSAHGTYVPVTYVHSVRLEYPLCTYV